MEDTFASAAARLWENASAGLHLGLDASVLFVADISTHAMRASMPVLEWFGWHTPIEQRQALTVLAAALGLLTFLMLLFWIRRKSNYAARAQLAAITRRPRMAGLIASGFLLAVFGGWSVLAPLASASIATGVVSPEGSRKTISHLEGGIIRSIHVREGGLINIGEPLVTLEDVQARARFEELQERYLYLLSIEARLISQRSGTQEITFPDELKGAQTASAFNGMTAQRKLLESQRTTQEGHESILRQRMLQIDEQNAGLGQVTVAQDRQLELLVEEIVNVQNLFDRGLAKADRLLALKRAEAGLDAERAGNAARIAENLQRKGETQIQFLTMREMVVEKANNELADIQRQLAEIRSQMPSRADVLQRTVIRAPISGTIINITATTVSAVVRPGETILEIVPKEAKLIIDARVSPNDIDRVRPGMQARIVLTAYRQRSLPLIHGVLTSISADRLIEERTGAPYFLAKIEVNREDLDSLEDVRLMPGMSAEIMILNGEQTILQYLFDPLLGSINRSFRQM